MISLSREERELRILTAELTLKESEVKIPKLNDGIKYGGIATACYLFFIMAKEMDGIVGSLSFIFGLAYVALTIFTIYKAGLSDYWTVCSRAFNAVMELPIPAVNWLMGGIGWIFMLLSPFFFPILYYGVARIMVYNDVCEAKDILVNLAGRKFDKM